MVGVIFKFWKSLKGYPLVVLIENQRHGLWLQVVFVSCLHLWLRHKSFKQMRLFCKFNCSVNSFCHRLIVIVGLTTLSLSIQLTQQSELVTVTVAATCSSPVSHVRSYCIVGVILWYCFSYRLIVYLFVKHTHTHTHTLVLANPMYM